MKFIKKRNINLVQEFNSKHKEYIINREKDFTISYEIELESKSQTTELSDMLEIFNRNFKNLIDKWDLDFDYDTSLIDDQYVDMYGDQEEIKFGNIQKFDDYYSKIDYEEPTYELYEFGDEKKYFAGVEIAPFTYFNGINDAFNFLDEFYRVYEKQRMFVLSNKTGLHTNIGFHIKSKWNLLKGYLLFNEDYAYTGFTHRKENKFSSSYKQEFKNNVKKYIEKNYSNFGTLEISSNYTKIVDDLNKILLQTVLDIGEKHVGFNITKVKNHNYIEFRHPGGDVKKEDIKNQTLYYANIVLACVDPEYRKQEYQKKLFSFLKNINISHNI